MFTSEDRVTRDAVVARIESVRKTLDAFEDRARTFTESLEAFRSARLKWMNGNAKRIEPIPELTPRELAILRLIADGCDNEAIAKNLHFGLGTIKLHVRDILEKLNVPTRTAAAVRAVRLGLI